MPKITREEVRVPADVMPEARDEYITNYLKATRETGRLMLFACDQKIEHLNKDFYGEGIDISIRSICSRSAPRACAACSPASAGWWPSTRPTTRRSTTSSR